VRPARGQQSGQQLDETAGRVMVGDRFFLLGGDLLESSPNVAADLVPFGCR
jgi:hypothetical protein